ncbi:hypothetical protein V1525DRAFT_2680 [Lipomyces kononenkoae]|uniref:Uncharacterized protein n=1 Tax=Lipomyces kononenkoae TaxID=34357 RepID=A0ACC3TBA2_LIPKO
MDRKSFSDSRGDSRPINVKLSMTPSPAFAALVSGTPIAGRRAELFAKVKMMVATSRLHSTTPDSKVLSSASSHTPSRSLNDAIPTPLVSPPISPTPKRKSDITVHKPLHTLTQVHQNGLVSFPSSKSSDDNYYKFTPTDQENMPRASTPTEIAVSTTTTEKDEALEYLSDPAWNGFSMSKVITVREDAERVSVSRNDMIDKLTTDNTAGAGKRVCLVSSQVAASGKSDSRPSVSEGRVQVHLRGEYPGTTEESSQLSSPGDSVPAGSEGAGPVAMSQCDTDSSGKFRQGQSVDQARSLPQADKSGDTFLLNLPKCRQQSMEYNIELLTRQQSNNDEDRGTTTRDATETLTSTLTPTFSQSQNIFRRVRHKLKISHILYIFAVIAEAQKHCRIANNRRTKAAIIRTVRLGLRSLSRPFEESIRDRLNKVKTNFESEISNANLTPKTIWNRLAAEFLVDVTRTDLSSRLIPFSGTLKLVASLSPRNTLPASYFVSLVKTITDPVAL